MALSSTVAVFLLAGLLLVQDSYGTFTNNCMKCICEVEGCQVGSCRWDGNADSCGPYQIKKLYWEHCGSPEGSWRNCTKQMDCSETCVQNYMKKYGKNCTKNRTPTCRDYAMIHNGGPKGCRKNLKRYWKKVQKCCKRKGGC